MNRADEIQVVTPELCVWQAYEPSVKCDLTSAALRVGEHLVLIDPIPLSATAVQELEAVGRPALVVCTNGNHARAAEHFHRHYRIPIAAHSEAQTELGFTVEHSLAEGSRLLDTLEVCTLPGAAPGEIALVAPHGIVCFGDALIHLPPLGFGLLPDKYCADAELLRQSLRKLLRWDFRVLTFAHGLPLVTSARERFTALLP